MWSIDRKLKIEFKILKTTNFEYWQPPLSSEHTAWSWLNRIQKFSLHVLFLVNVVGVSIWIWTIQTNSRSSKPHLKLW